MTIDVHTLSGAYALDALSAEEAAEFREHLTSCQACCDEVRELRAAASRLGAAEAAAPPDALRARVLAAAARTPQQPPATPTTSPAPTAPSTLPVRHADRPAARRRRAWLGAVAAAAVIVTGGIVGVNAMVDDEPALTTAAAQVFAADDARTLTVKTDNGGEARVGVSHESGEMAVDARELPQLDAEHAYQLWTVHDGEATSAGVLAPGATGAAMALPSGKTQVAVTVEPREGSEQPTTEPLAVVDPTEV